jgi:hypothetical protein
MFNPNQGSTTSLLPLCSAGSLAEMKCPLAAKDRRSRLNDFVHLFRQEFSGITPTPKYLRIVDHYCRQLNRLPNHTRSAICKLSDPEHYNNVIRTAGRMRRHTPQFDPSDSALYNLCREIRAALIWAELLRTQKIQPK